MSTDKVFGMPRPRHLRKSVVAVIGALLLLTAPVAAEIGRPQARLTEKPKREVRTAESRATVNFAFTTRPLEADATFECSIDSKPYRGCRSPKRYRLKPGGHAFKVRAVDADGTAGPAASASFRVVAIEPPSR